MRVALKSTFWDYYDHVFEREGDVTFYRTGGNSGPTKPEQFRQLQEAGYKTPPVGRVHDLFFGDLSRWEEGLVEYVVVYDDLMAHCTEGKRLLHVSEYTEEDADLFASAFVGKPGPPSKSIRHLFIGPHLIELKCESTESWMSNYGEGTWTVTTLHREYGFTKIARPLFAIDFVKGTHALYAVDLNFAPGLMGTGINVFFTGREIYRAIQRFYENKRGKHAL